jgi:phosphoglycerol transferase MdoB-like AlkP superfamily enzyme
MSALGLIAYLVVALFVGAIVTIAYSVFRSVKKHDDFRSWRFMCAFAIIAAAAPYLYAEFNTAQKGASMTKAVEATIKSAKVKGKLSYFKVMQSTETTARLIIVAKEKTTTNDSESCVIEATLKMGKKGWQPDTFQFVDSFDRGKDGVTFPPYW